MGVRAVETMTASRMGILLVVWFVPCRSKAPKRRRSKRHAPSFQDVRGRAQKRNAPRSIASAFHATIVPMSSALPRLFDQTIDLVSRAFKDATGQARVWLTGELRPDLPDDDLLRLKRQIDACLKGAGGEVSARARAADIGRTYLDLSAEGRRRFFRLLASDYGVARADVDAAIGRVQEAGDGGARARAETALREALIAPRIILFTRLNALPQGIKFLVDLRADLRAAMEQDPGLEAVDDELRRLLVSWFDVGFLELRRIGWNAPAALLEKLITYEAVHEIRSWTDLKNRLGSDRRCFAFFHPRMPDEPLIFVEVALTSGIAGSIQALLDENAPALDPQRADTAIFYSISNCQRGLDGVSFGSFLIKRVVDQLGGELPNLKTFATLSPIPGFRAWLERTLATEPELLDEAQRATLARADWPQDETASTSLEAPLTRLCARYLVRETRGGSGPGGKARDRVAHFHLSNGARIERLNWRGDVSPAGLRQSYGLMVNYRYVADWIEANHEAYATEGTIAAASAVRRLVRTGA
jgi:malonyl-CoA decarboxylase